jgi:hypothetical protein
MPFTWDGSGPPMKPVGVSFLKKIAIFAVIILINVVIFGCLCLVFGNPFMGE